MIQIYSPTNEAEEDDKDSFYDQLQEELDTVPNHYMVIVIGDANAKVGDSNCNGITKVRLSGVWQRYSKFNKSHRCHQCNEKIQSRGWTDFLTHTDERLLLDLYSTYTNFVKQRISVHT